MAIYPLLWVPGAGLCAACDVDYIVVNADEVDLGGTEVVQRGVIVCAAPGAMVCQTTSLGMKPNTSCGIQLVEGDALHAHRAHHGSGGAPSSCGGGFAPGPRQKTNLSWIGKLHQSKYGITYYSRSLWRENDCWSHKQQREQALLALWWTQRSLWRDADALTFAAGVDDVRSPWRDGVPDSLHALQHV